MKTKKNNKKQLKNPKNQPKNNKILIIITSIALSIIAFLFLERGFQNDTFYTLKLGELIFNQGIDYLDHFSFISNLTYMYPHWLYDLVIYLIYHFFNYNGLFIFNYLSYLVLIFILYYVNIHLNNNKSIISFVILLTCICLAPYITLRAQTISYIIFILEVFFIERLINTNKTRYIIYLFLLALLLANIHSAVFPLFFILYLPYLAEHLLSKFNWSILKSFNINKIPNIKKLLISFIVAFLSGLLTPIKDMPYTYTIRIMLGNTQKYILEHNHLDFTSYAPMIVVILLIIILTTILIKNKKKVAIKDFFMILGLLIMAFMANRHFALLIAIGVIYFIRILESTISNKTFLNIINTNIINYICMFELLIISLFRYNNFNHQYIEEDIYPIQAVQYIKENLDYKKIHIFNEYNFGSYLMFNDIPVFIDSRCDLYTKQFNNNLEYDIFDDFMAINNNYQEKFAYYEITHVLLYKTNSLTDILNKDRNYKVIYEDDYFILFKVL